MRQNLMYLSLSIAPYVAIDDLKFLVLWPLLPEQWWNCRHAPSRPVYATLGIEPRALCMPSKPFYQTGPQPQREESPKPSASFIACSSLPLELSRDLAHQISSGSGLLQLITQHRSLTSHCAAGICSATTQSPRIRIWFFFLDSDS